MSWATGLMLLCGLMVVVYLAAEIVDEDRKDIKRLRRIEEGRLAQRADYIESAAFYHREPNDGPHG